MAQTDVNFEETHTSDSSKSKPLGGLIGKIYPKDKLEILETAKNAGYAKVHFMEATKGAVGYDPKQGAVLVVNLDHGEPRVVTSFVTLESPYKPSGPLPN